MASETMTAYDPLATSGTWRRSRAKIGVYLLLGLFAAYYLLPLVVVSSTRSAAFPRSPRTG